VEKQTSYEEKKSNVSKGTAPNGRWKNFKNLHLKMFQQSRFYEALHKHKTENVDEI
jgi:hypothetical protein